MWQSVDSFSDWSAESRVQLAIMHHSVFFSYSQSYFSKASQGISHSGKLCGQAWLTIFYTVLYSAKSQGLAGNLTLRPKRQSMKKLLKSNEKTIPVILVILWTSNRPPQSCESVFVLVYSTVLQSYKLMLPYKACHNLKMFVLYTLLEPYLVLF